MDEYGGTIHDNFPAAEELDNSRCPDITTKSNGRFEASFHVAHAFFPLLIGKKGVTKKRLEQETKTRINIPRQGECNNIEAKMVINQSTPF